MSFSVSREREYEPMMGSSLISINPEMPLAFRQTAKSNLVRSVKPLAYAQALLLKSSDQAIRQWFHT